MTNKTLESLDTPNALRGRSRLPDRSPAVVAARATPTGPRSSPRTLLMFFALAFALSWWPWPLLLLNPASVPLLPWGPLGAALIAAAVAGGRRGLRDLLRGAVRWRVGARWYAAALLLPAASTALAAALNVLLGADAPRAADFGDWYTFPLVLLVTLFLKGPLTEEVAWRGFALPRLLDRLPPAAASVLLGVVWASWHLPLLVSDPSAQRPPLQFAVSTVAMSVLFTWLYLRTRGSVLLAALMHAMFNSLAPFVFPLFRGADYGRLWWLYAGALWAAALAALLFGRGLQPHRGGAAPGEGG
jgi:membrane protease YdiL (CAAX protease family)